MRRVLLSKPVCATVLLFALYLIFGFFALPAIVKWQIEKQVPEKLGHPISVGEVRCNPLLLTFEVGDLVLSNTEGSPILSFKRLQIDFAMRSVVDQAWTFSLASLEAPVARLNFDKEGRHSFSALLERRRTGIAGFAFTAICGIQAFAERWSP